jgi:hypothetical protein
LRSARDELDDNGRKDDAPPFCGADAFDFAAVSVRAGVGALGFVSAARNWESSAMPAAASKNVEGAMFRPRLF